MIKAVFTISLSLFSVSAFASSSALADIAKIAGSKAVNEFIDSKNLQVSAVEYRLTAFCAGGPSNYVILATDKNGKRCEVWAQVGDCEKDELKNHVTLLTTSSDLKCE